MRKGNESALILTAESRSSFDPRLNPLLTHPDATIRADLADALGRIGAEPGIPMLVELLNDRESEVRERAAFAASQWENRTPSKTLGDALVARVATEPSEGALAAVVRALPRVKRTTEIADLVRPFLDDSRAGVREAAMQSIAYLGAHDIAPKKAREAACRLLMDRDNAVRLGAASAIVALEGEPDSKACRASLVQILKTDPEDEVRIQAARALAATRSLNAEIIDLLLEDGDYRVSANAFEALNRSDDPQACDQAKTAVDRLADSLTKRPELKDALFVQGLASALSAAMSRCVSWDSLKASASKIDALLTVDRKPEDKMVTQAVCSAGALSGADDIDILGCDETDSRFGKKRLIAKLQVQPVDRTVTDTLTELMKDADPSVAADALHAALKTAPDHAARIGIATACLADDRMLMNLAALNEIADNPPLFLVDGKTPEEIRSAMETVVSRYKDFDHAFMPLVFAARAAASLGDAVFGPMLLDMAKDSRLPVRSAAVRALLSMEGFKSPAGLPPLAEPEEAAHSLAEFPREADFSALLQLSIGDVVFIPDTDASPLSVAGLIESASAGDYNDSVIYRATPGEAVYFGDPTGSGLGDPGWYTPMEKAPTKVERGAVVILYEDVDVRVGRFVVALRRMPEWDGKVAVIGRVTSGMELLDRAVEGDKVVEVRVSQLSRRGK